MTIGERIKKVRKEKHLTQQELAKKIGSVQNTITGYETGRREPSSAVIALICREFHVNETWLRTGEGEMFSQPSSQAEQVVAWVQNIFTNGTEAEKGLITAMSTFTKEDWAMLAHLIKKIWESQQAAPAKEPHAFTEQELEVYEKVKAAKEKEDAAFEAETAALHRQLDMERAAEKKDALESFPISSDTAALIGKKILAASPTAQAEVTRIIEEDEA